MTEFNSARSCCGDARIHEGTSPRLSPLPAARGPLLDARREHEDNGLSADPANRRRRPIRTENDDEDSRANLALHPTRAGAIVRAHG